LSFRGNSVSLFGIASMPPRRRSEAARILLNPAVVISRTLSSRISLYSGLNALVRVSPHSDDLFTPLENNSAGDTSSRAKVLGSLPKPPLGDESHDPNGWSPHFLDKFVLISSGGTDPVPKAGRLAQLGRPGIGPAPAQLAANPVVRFVHFGDTAVMMAQTSLR
jgi:hypothetical protein